MIALWPVSHAILAVNAVAFVSAVILFAVLVVRLPLPPGSVLRAYTQVLATWIALALASIVSLYIETNLPGEMSAVRRAYFLLLVIIVACLVAALSLAYARFFLVRGFARRVLLTLPAVGALFVLVIAPGQPSVFDFLRIISGYFVVVAGVTLAGFAWIVFTLSAHRRKIKDERRRKLFSLALSLVALLLGGYAARIVCEFTGLQAPFFNRTHFALFLLVHNAVVFALVLRHQSHEMRTFDAAVLAHYQLTAREAEIIRAVIQGLSNREIARQLDVAEGTVKVFLYHIFRKTAVRGRMALANLARTW